VNVDVELYEKVRRDSALFFVIPGYEDAAVEDISDSGGDYLVVRVDALQLHGVDDARIVGLDALVAAGHTVDVSLTESM
jgi:hypothetical protein